MNVNSRLAATETSSAPRVVPAQKALQPTRARKGSRLGMVGEVLAAVVEVWSGARGTALAMRRLYSTTARKRASSKGEARGGGRAIPWSELGWPVWHARSPRRALACRPATPVADSGRATRAPAGATRT